MSHYFAFLKSGAVSERMAQCSLMAGTVPRKGNIFGFEFTFMFLLISKECLSKMGDISCSGA